MIATSDSLSGVYRPSFKPLNAFDVSPQNTLAQSLVWFRGAAAPYHYGVGKKPVLLLELSVDEPIASAEEEYQHEYSPCHRKARERRAEFVALGCAPYFFEEFNHIVVV